MPKVGAPASGGGVFTGGEVSSEIKRNDFDSGNDTFLSTYKLGQSHYAFKVSCNGVLYWSDGVNAADIYLYRKAAGKLDCGCMFCCDTLAVEQVSSASVLGTVTGKLAILDNLDNVQGYVPLYDAIA